MESVRSVETATRNSFKYMSLAKPLTLTSLPCCSSATVQLSRHQGHGGVAGIHQDRAELEAASLDRIEHLGDVIEFSLAIPLRVEEAIVNNPIAVEFRMVVNQIDDADAFNHTVRVAAVWRRTPAISKE